MGRASVRRALREKFQRAVDEVVSRHTDDVRAELAATRAALLESREHLERVVRGVEIRQRRDLFFAGEVRALAETERFVAAHLSGVRTFDHPHATLRFALELAAQDDAPDGLALEFGVADGTSLRLMVAGLPRSTPVGFDVFTGLPEVWRPGFPRGTFAQDQRPDVPGAELVVGLFEQTLPEFLRTHPGPVAFLHLDADLYRSTRTVLDQLGARLVRGSVVVLDEYFNYPGWQDGEFQAWHEFVDASGLQFRYEGYTFDNEQVVVRVTEPARAQRASDS